MKGSLDLTDSRTPPSRLEAAGRLADSAPLSRPVAELLRLQGTAGNAAVARMLAVRRATATETAPIAGRSLSSEQARAQLSQMHRRLRAMVAGDKEGARVLKELREDQWFVSSVSELVAGLPDFPEPGTAWVEADALLARAGEELVTGDIVRAAHALQDAERAAQKAHRRLAEYKGSTEHGAELATTGLQVTAAAGAIAATVATGGAAAAAGAGLVGTAATVGVGAGAYGIIQEEAGQGGEMLAGTRKAGDFDVKALLVRGGRDAVVGFVGTLAGGALSKYAVGYLGRAAMAGMQPAQLAAVAEALGVEAGALTPELFVTAGRRFIVDFLAGIATTPLTTAVQVTIDQVSGQKAPSADQFAHMVMENAVQGGIVQLFLGGLTHGWTSAGLKTGFERAESGSHGTGPTRTGASRSEPTPVPEPTPAPEPAVASAPTPVPEPTPVQEPTPVAEPTPEGHAQGKATAKLGPTPEGANEVKVTDAEYKRVLEAAFVERGMEPTFKVIDEVGRRAAAEVVKDPDFVDACKKGKWMKAGRMFHRAAELAGKQLAATAGDAQGFTFEDTIKGGKGGARADALSPPQGGQVKEYDWKTTGRGALGSVEQMKKHSKLLGSQRKLTLSGQESVSWVDYVRGLLKGHGIKWP